MRATPAPISRGLATQSITCRVVIRCDSQAHDPGMTPPWATMELPLARTKERGPAQSARGCQYFQCRLCGSTVRPRIPACASNATIAGTSSGVDGRPTHFIATGPLAMQWMAIRGSARHEELGERCDAPAAHLDEIHQLGRHDRAGDLGVNVDPPVDRGPHTLDRERQELVAAQLERLHEYREPGADHAHAAGVERDPFAIAGAPDPQAGVAGEHPAQTLEVPVHTRRVQLPHQPFNLQAIRHPLTPSAL